MTDDLLEPYFRALAEVASQGDAREESYYPALKDLLEGFAASTGRDGAHVTVLPRRTEAGNPDVRVWDGTQHVTGYLEAKTPGADLDAVEESEQLRRYRDTFPNLVLTDFCEFRLYRDGEPVLGARAGRPYVLTDLEQPPPVEEGEETAELLETFFGFSVPKAYDAETLALELAKRTRFMRDVVRDLLGEELEAEEGDLLGFYEAFQEYLIAGLEPLDFADLYAQTLTYGLFAARIRAGDDFNRAAAADHIPESIGILHEIFEFISYRDVPEPLAWMVDDIAEVLAVAEAGEILDRYYRQGKGTDPVVHFYETFLAEYDPREREQRGVFYTPEPVVSYIVRSLHRLLKERFGKDDGLASDGVTLLDPAAGTMTFVARATREAVEEFAGKYGEGAVDGFLTDHVLENFYAFELMMAPYAVGHLKMSFLLEELGHRLGEDERFRLYLTNTLEMEELDQTRLPGLKSLAEESHLAGEVKRETPILVILGNPPYSGHSANKGEWARELISEYQQIHGEPLGEVQQKWLHDDYVKFLRFAEWKIAREGEGVVGMITNHSWLDNPTFRGMRWHLLDTYDEIHVLDLHGNSLKRETTPEGGPDENVFDIRQGVAISFFLRSANGDEDEPATVHHADLWGLREEKYAWLEGHDVAGTGWTEVTPREEFYLYVPRDEAALERYSEFPKVTELFPENSVGLVTSRDSFTIDWSSEDLWRKLSLFIELDPEEARKAFDLGDDSRDWKVHLAQEDLRDSGPDRDLVVPITYRPFDRRLTYFTGTSRGFMSQPQRRVMSQMLSQENIGLGTTRSIDIASGFAHAFCFRGLFQHHSVSIKEVNYAFPLYLYPDTSGNDLFDGLDEPRERRPNFHPRLLPGLQDAYGRKPSPEEVFHYVYAVLYAHSYREKYADFLKIDFPRVPFTADPELFGTLAGLGERLVSLHLLESDELDPPAARFHGEGDNRVVRRKSQGFRYDAERQRKYINPDQYFAPVPLELWEYRIGGYQVLHKWLKDRKERRLSTDEVRTCCRIVTALERTIGIQEEIDALYPEAEAEVVELRLGD